jgi:hypothetical protein
MTPHQPLCHYEAQLTRHKDVDTHLRLTYVVHALYFNPVRVRILDICTCMVRCMDCQLSEILVCLSFVCLDHKAAAVVAMNKRSLVPHCIHRHIERAHQPNPILCAKGSHMVLSFRDPSVASRPSSQQQHVQQHVQKAMNSIAVNADPAR